MAYREEKSDGKLTLSLGFRVLKPARPLAKILVDVHGTIRAPLATISALAETEVPLNKGQLVETLFFLYPYIPQYKSLLPYIAPVNSSKGPHFRSYQTLAESLSQPLALASSERTSQWKLRAR